MSRPNPSELIAHGLSPNWQIYHRDQRGGLRLETELHIVHVFGVGSAWTVEVRRRAEVVATQAFIGDGMPYEAMEWGEQALELAEDPGMPEEFGYHKGDGD